MEFSSPNVVKQGNNYSVSYGDDSGLHVVFGIEAIPDPERTLSEGRPCFKDIEIIDIYIAGGDQRHRPVQYETTAHQLSDPERFPRQWAAFKSKDVQVNEGTPLEEWPPITKSLAYELKAMNIFTVESLATLPDGKLTWMGARELQQKAKLYIDKAKESAPMLAMQEENEKLRRDMEALKAQFAGMELDKKSKKKVKEDDDIS